MILIIDNYDSFVYNLYQSVATIYADVEVIRNDKITVEEILRLNPRGIIISPGPGHPDRAGIGIQLVKAVAAKIPILGVCLGHQIIARAFGGKVAVAAQAVHGKETYVFHHRQELYASMPLPFLAGRYHSLIVTREEFPKSLLVEAENDRGLIMGVRHQEFPVYGVQYHPESILTPEGNRLIENFINICKKHTYESRSYEVANA